MPILKLALALWCGSFALAQDLSVDQIFAVSIDADGVHVSVRDRARLAAHHVDRDLLVFMTMEGRLYAADVRPRLDGTLPDLHAVPVANLNAAMGDLAWWTALIGTLSAAQAAGVPGAVAGDVIIGRQDFDGPQFVTTIARRGIEAEIECARLMSVN